MEAHRLPANPVPPAAASGPRGPLKARIQTMAAAASAAALLVDREGRFPAESFAEARAQRLLGIMVPPSFGGEGASLPEIVDLCYTLGQACSATAMIYAMHQIKLACLVRHSAGNPVIENILRRVASEELLLASSTTEGHGGGNVRSSEAPVEHDGERIRLERKATVISYALAADGVVTTARRSAESAANEQVLVVFLKEDYTLERLHGWNTLGMRGTCSEGYTLRAEGVAGQILTEPYERIHSQTMVPVAHLTWGAVWTGIATAATARAQAFIRHSLRQSGGQLPPAAAHYTQALATLRTLRGLLASGLQSYERARDDARVLSSLDFQSMITLTKVQTSELALETVMHAMRCCGLSGYRNDGEFSIGRHLRDVLSSPLMINNDRILANLATSSLLTPLPTSLSG